MIIQLLICTCIYALFCIIRNNGNIFGKQIIENISNILNYDINFKSIYISCEEYFKNNKVLKINIEKSNDNSVVENNSKIEIQEVEQNQETTETKSQMEQDAEYIKKNYNLIMPVNGNITSGYGDREPSEIISAFHQGIDISASQGTPINAAMEGNVIAASYAGDYGNHIKIQNGEIITVYAHCSEINVNVGDYIAQNQVIGKVGATRKSNRGPFAF